MLWLLLACGPRPGVPSRPDEPATERLMPLGTAPMEGPRVTSQSQYQGVFAALQPPPDATVQIDGDHLVATWTDGSSAADRGAAITADLIAAGFSATPTVDTDGGYVCSLSRADGRVVGIGGATVDGITTVVVTDLGDLSDP